MNCISARIEKSIKLRTQPEGLVVGPVYRLDRSVNEVWLFHGTSEEAALATLARCSQTTLDSLGLRPMRSDQSSSMFFLKCLSPPPKKKRERNSEFEMYENTDIVEL